MRLLLFSLVALPLLLGCESEDTIPAFRADGTVSFFHADSTHFLDVTVEISDTPAARAQGLMHRLTLPENSGMLFVYPEAAQRGFWMKDTPLSLDMIFVDSNGQILNIVHSTRPFSTERSFSVAPAQYVVEVIAGFTKEQGIDSTAFIQWKRFD